MGRNQVSHNRIYLLGISRTDEQFLANESQYKMLENKYSFKDTGEWTPHHHQTHTHRKKKFPG